MLASGLGCRTKNRGASERASMSGSKREPGPYSRRARCVGKRRGGADVAKRWFPPSTVPGMVAALPTTGTASDALDVPTKRAPCDWKVGERTASLPARCHPLTESAPPSRRAHAPRRPWTWQIPTAIHIVARAWRPHHVPAPPPPCPFSRQELVLTPLAVSGSPRNISPRRARVRVEAQPAVPDIRVAPAVEECSLTASHRTIARYRRAPTRVLLSPCLMSCARSTSYHSL